MVSKITNNEPREFQQIVDSCRFGIHLKPSKLVVGIANHFSHLHKQHNMVFWTNFGLKWFEVSYPRDPSSRLSVIFWHHPTLCESLWAHHRGHGNMIPVADFVRSRGIDFQPARGYWPQLMTEEIHPWCLLPPWYNFPAGGMFTTLLIFGNLTPDSLGPSESPYQSLGVFHSLDEQEITLATWLTRRD